MWWSKILLYVLCPQWLQFSTKRDSIDHLLFIVQLLDAMEPMMASGGKIVDYHSNEFFPERWFDIVFVLRTDNTILYDRLVSR